MVRKIVVAVLVLVLIAGVLVMDAKQKKDCANDGGTWVGGSQRGAGCIGDDKGLL